MSRRKILLTGATGFLGSNILKRIIAEYEVAIITRSTSNLEKILAYRDSLTNFVLERDSIEHIISTFQPDYIIHCATDYGRKSVPQIQVIEANLILPLKLFHAATKAGLKMFINTDTFLDKGINHYSLSKRQFKEWFQTYSNETLCVNMVLEHFYGPFDDKTKFVSFVINELIQNRSNIQLTPGTQKRNFIFIEDVVEAFLTVLRHDFEKPSGFFEFFIASEQTISIKEFVIKLKELVGNTVTNLDFGALPFRPNEIMDSSVDISAMKQLGWSPKTNLLEGLTHTIEIEKNRLVNEK